MAEILTQIQGHQALKERLLSAVAQKRLPHAVLLAGPSGIGKKKLAWALSQILLCERRSESEVAACGQCGSCVRIEKQQSESVLFIGPDESKASGVLNVDQAREILEFVSLRSFAARGRTVIIENAHMLNLQAANLLLKTLEEPPENTYFFLLTSQPTSLLTTIRSRSQRVNVAPLPAGLVKQIVDCPEWVAQASRGSCEAAAMLMDESFNDLRKQAAEMLLAALKVQNWDAESLKDLVKERQSAQWVTTFWLQFLRDARVARTGVGSLIHPDLVELKALSAVSAASLDQFFTQAFKVLDDIMANVDRTLLFENAILNFHGAELS